MQYKTNAEEEKSCCKNVIPDHYLELICCPKCRSNLESNNAENKLFCQTCKSSYPVINKIPILLPDHEDEVSKIVKKFYDSEWKRNRNGVFRAKAKQEDLSNLAQLYTKINDRRFLPLFQESKGHKFFLDAASGAQPRVEFGSKYTYHICVDFSLTGLIECRKILGNRAICVSGSILSLPLKDLTCDGVIASHVLYQVDKDLQKDAIRELYRVLRPEGKLLIFYGNQNSLEKFIINTYKKIIGKKAEINITDRVESYYYNHTIEYMLNVLRKEFNNSSIKVEFLRTFSKRITQKAFKSTLFGKVILKMIVLLEHLLRKRPSLSYYVAYIVEK